MRSAPEKTELESSRRTDKEWVANVKLVDQELEHTKDTLDDLVTNIGEVEKGLKTSEVHVKFREQKVAEQRK